MRIIYTAILALSFPVYAVVGITDNMTISGFGSTSWAQSDNPTSLIINRSFTDDSCYDCDTTFGVQLDYYYDSFKASAQVVKRPQDGWGSPQIEWAYLGYEFNELDLHIGRLRLPLFLASEYYYVGHAYKTARPATEVYNSILGITAFNGLSTTWHFEFNDEQSLIFTPFYGLKDENDVEFSPTTTLEFTTKRMFGFNAILNGDHYRWNLALLDSSFDQKSTSKAGNQTTVLQENDQNIVLWSLGTEYEIGPILLTIEGQTNHYSSAWYSSIAYHYETMTPYIRYAAQYDDNKKMTGDSYLLGVRYDLHYNVSLNGEVQYFDTRKGRGAFVTTPEPNDALLYTVILNFVF